jgi:2-polyprenyl-3-methyl-5-hydroxy-6-metoxy-1,4-benzoquinol methylase
MSVVVDVRRNAKTSARRALIAALERLTGRTAVLLPREAKLVALLDARAPYRIAGERVHYDVHVPSAGRLRIRLLAHVTFGTPSTLSEFDELDVDRDTRLTLNLREGTLHHEEKVVGRFAGDALPPRFTTHFEFHNAMGHSTRRLGHYVVRHASDEAYFTGSHYRDYEAQAAGDVSRTIAKLQHWRAPAPLLEIGCATGLLLAACREIGIDAVGMDMSQWAVTRARTRVGTDHVVLADAEATEFPPAIATRRFGTAVMNAVLEHVARPHVLLDRVASVVAPGGLLFLTTANANSLTRWFFGNDWEGLSDPTHKSADTITPDRLTTWLRDTGWTVEHLTTHSIWDDNPDPLHATLRDVAAADARFRQLLVQYQRGDFLECVARRRTE